MTFLDESIATAEQMIKAYPESPELALALRTLLQNQRLLLSAELKKPSDVEAYFQSLADASASPAAKSKILFALAAYVAEGDRNRAVDLMNKAFDTKVVYSPQDLDFYGLALVDAKKFNEATAVFDKLAADYPIPAGTPANQAPRLIQEAQAMALFGEGRVAQASGKAAEAGRIFEQLKALYPWSPKVLEADYGIAEALRAKGDPDKALALLPAIIRADTASADLRANSMLLGGFIMKDRMSAATDPKAKDDALAAGIDYFIKIAQFYGGVPVAAARGLWEGGQLLEAQANAATDAKFKTQQLDRAKAAYKQLVTDYPNSEFAPKAQERLTALGGK
jgi:tetratricopeptide (TPR) repeat protein